MKRNPSHSELAKKGLLGNSLKNGGYLRKVVDMRVMDTTWSILKFKYLGKFSLWAITL
jgi:hypothetical protein